MGTKRSAITTMRRSLTTKRSRFPRQFVILKSTTVFLEAVLTQTFIPEALDSVPKAISPDLTPDIIPDTTPDTTLDTILDTTQDSTLALAILADRFVLICYICFRIHN